MHQAGVVAGPALECVRIMWQRVGEDNQRARSLGQRLQELGLEVRDTDINMVFVKLPEGFKFD